MSNLVETLRSKEMTAPIREAMLRALNNFEDLVKTLEWYAQNGHAMSHELHHFLAVEARGNFLESELAELRKLVNREEK